MVKIIFLNVDGIINVPHGMDKKILANLKDIVDSTGCKIVISSDWHSGADTIAEIKRTLSTVGLDFIACTPASQSIEPRRPEEILKFIACHNMSVKQGRRGDRAIDMGPVEQWVVIDDRPLLSEPKGGPGLAGHFVQTRSTTGLTAQCAQMAKDILMCNKASSSSSSTSRAMTEVSTWRSQLSIARSPSGDAADRHLPTLHKRCFSSAQMNLTSSLSKACSRTDKGERHVRFALPEISSSRPSSMCSMTTVASLQSARSFWV